MTALLNYTNRPLLFVYKDNLRPMGNNRYQIDSEELLQKREFLPMAGAALRVQVRTDTLQLQYGLPLVQETLLGADGLPEGEALLIVSKQYAEACRRLCRPTHRLRIVCGGVYVPHLNFPVASTGIARVEACLPYSHPALFSLANGQPNTEGAADYIRQQRHLLETPVVPLDQITRPVYPDADEGFPPATDDERPIYGH